MGEAKLLNFIVTILQWFLKLKKMAAEEQTEQKGKGLKIFTPKKLF